MEKDRQGMDFEEKGMTKAYSSKLKLDCSACRRLAGAKIYYTYEDH